MIKFGANHKRSERSMRNVEMRARKSVEEVLKIFKTSEKGLTEEEAAERLKKYGFNELKEKKKIVPLKVLSRQFVNFIVWVLFAAALISYFKGDVPSFWAISAIIVFVILLGFVQEYKAEKAMKALKKIVQPTTKVLRNGKVKEILTKYVVPGDVLLLETGDKIPADAKIFEVIGLKVDEASLTGESIPVEKSEGDLVFAGTQNVHGKCKAVVIATGMQTELGKIAGLIQEVEEKTPLQIKIAQLAKTLATIALIVCVFVFLLGLWRGAPIEEILPIALALAVAAVPEGLPLTLTLTLAFGMYRMAKHNAIVRRMLGVETLGSTTIICTDKTGTLTKNEMTVQKIWTDDKIFDVSGVGYEPKGKFFINYKDVNFKQEENLILTLKASALCNNAILEQKEGEWRILGDPTEAALLVVAAKANLWKDDLEKEYPRVGEMIFTSERKLMTTIHLKSEEKIAFTKGAPEVVLKKCKFIEKNGEIERLSKDEMARILKINEEFASFAFRVLGVAYKKVVGPLTPENVEEDLIFLGLVAMMDPPREEVEEALKTCKKAGIKVVMVTGDNKETAKAIAKKIGLLEEKEEFLKVKAEKLRRIGEDKVITGSELDELSDEEFEQIVEEICIYARIAPEQKFRIVEALKKKGHIVAMTGDGVNDAPALKKADIGVAMGIKGTDVARESSTMILQDDNFATIVEAVKQGRTIYGNIEKFTTYLISRNFNEIILILLGIILLGPKYLPLLALQILFINTFDEIMPATGLGLDPPRKEIMFKKPRNPKEKILKKRNLALICSLATFIAVTSFLIFYFNKINIDKARTLAFTTITCTIFLIPFAFRSLEEPVYKVGILTNKLLIAGVFCTLLLTLSVMYIPFFQEILKLTPLNLVDWIIPLSAAFATLIFIEIVKQALKKLLD